MTLLPGTLTFLQTVTVEGAEVMPSSSLDLFTIEEDWSSLRRKLGTIGTVENENRGM